MSTEDVIRKLTKAQRRALDRLAMGQTPFASMRTLSALADRGLLAPVQREAGMFCWIEYHMPIAVHMAWCNVGSAEYDAMTSEEKAEAER